MNEDPHILFDAWMVKAEASEPNDPNAMMLATVGADGLPSARIVLMKAHENGGFTFYTNSESQKGREIAANPNVALLFHWKSLGRQIRITGAVAPVDAETANAYFATRPRISQLGAWASDQSRPLRDRETLEMRLAEVEKRYQGRDVPRPPHWWGYRLEPKRFEFWQAGEYRLHQRYIFESDGAGGWTRQLLNP